MSTYYVRQDGTAANKEAATGPASSQSACMNVSVHNGETFTSPPHTIIRSDQGGIYRSTFIPPTPGTDGNIITYDVDGSPIFSGSEDLTSATYKWTESPAQSGEYYCELSGAGPPASRFLNEKFEAVGFDETGWGVTETGNGVVDEDAATSAVGSPATWGDECMRVYSEAGDVASAEQTYSTAQAVQYFRTEIIVTDYLSLGTTGAMNVAFARDASFNQLFALGIIHMPGDALRVNAEFWHDGSFYQFQSGDFDHRGKRNRQGVVRSSDS